MKGEKRAQVKGARVKIELNLIEMIYGQVNSSFSPSLIYYTYIYYICTIIIIIIIIIIKIIIIIIIIIIIVIFF